jgi:hypothetical protein
MKRIETKNIPQRFNVVAEYDGMFYSSLGVAASNKDAFRNHTMVTNNRNGEIVSFVEIEENEVTIKQIRLENTSDSIIFTAIDVAKYSYNKDYDELNIVYENFGESEQQKQGYRYFLYNRLLNKDEFDAFFASLVLNSSFYEYTVRTGVIAYNYLNIFHIYLYKLNKAITLMMDHGLVDEVNYLFRVSVDEIYSQYPVNAKTIKIAKDTNTNIKMAVRMLARYKAEEIGKLAKAASAFEFNSLSFWDELLNLPNEIKLIDFSNYLVKSLLINNNISLTSYEEQGSKALIREIIRFMVKFRDYYEMRSDKDEKFPDNLTAAHDISMLTYRNRMVEIENRKKAQIFREMVSKYADLAYSSDDVYKVIVPESPEDLDRESNSLHHCVYTYKDRVKKGQSQICFVRKNGEIYMTLEIRNHEKLIQAKKKFNALPDAEDIKFLKEWAFNKGIEIVSY